MPLPPLQDTFDSSALLAQVLSTLFEPSQVLLEKLVPKLSERLNEPNSCVRPGIETYEDLVDAALATMSKWTYSVKADFVGGHPRIGEVKTLSTLSAREQASKATPPEVLVRLGYLNACYEHRYPGLIYITFVNGRSRAEIAKEMEERLGLGSGESPAVEGIQPVDTDGLEWKEEVDRAVQGVGKIAKSRLQAL